jgi:hypothetical protein
LLVIEQGTNMVDHSDLWVERSINHLISAVKGKYTSLLWIGSPPARPDKISPDMLKRLDEVIAKCVLPFGSYYSSFSLHTDTNSFLTGQLNGTHLKRETAARWAEDVAKEIKRLLDHPALKEKVAYPAEKPG